ETSSAVQVIELAGQTRIESQEKAQRLVDLYSRRLEKNPTDVESLVKRGNLYFMLREFDQAVENYDRALDLDSQTDAAYFGRGMALGRQGFIKKGIKDLSVYIKRHPSSSLAYTKRGVRYLWINEQVKAQQDFNKAIELNPKNAEAHDDLGVIYAKQQYGEAILHFSTTIRLDPSYQKGYHNLAMAYYLVERDNLALDAVDRALSLNPQDRSSMILKAEILTVLGRAQEAQALRDEADFLPEGNWSESISIH
ncbi:MAG: tetratricopeptide repeat protein, partial [Thioalkalispiraceae bacterium]